MKSSEYFEKGISILQEISNSIVEKDNIGTIANLILDYAVSYTGAEKGTLMLINENEELYILAARGIDSRTARSYRVKMGEGIAGAVAARRIPVFIVDAEKDHQFKGERPSNYRTKSFISCPIVSKNKLFGVLNISDKKDGSPFAKEEADLIRIITNQAAVFFENASLMTQLKLKSAELETLNRKLAEADLVKTEFLARVSHELRTPLNSLKGSIYYLQRAGNISGTEQGEFYGIAADATNKLISMVENQLDSLRGEEDLAIAKSSIFSLKDVLHEVAGSTLLRATLSRKNIRLKIDIHEGTSGVVGDRISTTQFFTNLIEGISIYLQKNDSIEIRVCDGDVVKVLMIISRKLPESLLSLLVNWKNILWLDRNSDLLKVYLAYKIAEAHRWSLVSDNAGDSFVFSLSIPTMTSANNEVVVDATMDIFLEFVSELLDVNTCSIMLSNELTRDLTIRSAKGLDQEVVRLTRIRPGDKIAGWVALEGRPLLVEDIEKDARFDKTNAQQYNTKSLLSLPLKDEESVVGVLNLSNKKSSEAFCMRDYYIASAVSERISYFIKRLRSGDYREEVRRVTSNYQTLIGATRELSRKEPVYPDLVLKIMDELGASDHEKKNAVYSFMIYDLDPLVMSKGYHGASSFPSRDDCGFKIHSSATIDFFNLLEFSEDGQKAVAHLHEKYDGTGYPAGLKGEEIPLVSRIIAVVGAFHSMTARGGRDGTISWEKARQVIQADSGSHYDPVIVRAFSTSLKSMMARV